ncbi:MAG: pentapeptide repeat-containing protein [Methanotrichaceae archaeon]
MVQTYRLLVMGLLMILILAGSASGVPNSTTRISAADVVAKIKSGEPVDYRNVTIEGNLDLSGLNAPVSQAVSITNSHIDSINFDGITFEGPLDMRGSVFQKSASFAKAKFLTDALFTGSMFMGLTDFRYANFADLASFTSAMFFNDTSFGNAQFGGVARFLDASFAKDVDFNYAQFSKIASFWNVSFHNVSFLGTKFIDQTSFGYARFDGNSIFAGTNFGSDAVFKSSIFRGNTTFGLSKFDGLCDFTGVNFKVMATFLGTKFSDNVYFTNAKFDKDLIFEGARIYSIQLDDVVFAKDSKINLKDADFTRFVVRWNTIKDRLIYNGAAYQALVKNYKNLEWFDDADECYYQYRMTTMSQEPWGWIKIIDIISWLSCGYGVRVSYVTFWCLFTIIFFGAVYWAGNGMRRFELSGREVPTDGETTNGDRTSLTDAVYFSVAMFTTSQAPYYNYPVGFYRHLAMFEGILGWFFLGLFIVVLSGVLIR